MQSVWQTSSLFSCLFTCCITCSMKCIRSDWALGIHLRFLTRQRVPKVGCQKQDCLFNNFKNDNLDMWQQKLVDKRQKNIGVSQPTELSCCCVVSMATNRSCNWCVFCNTADLLWRHTSLRLHGDVATSYLDLSEYMRYESIVFKDGGGCITLKYRSASVTREAS